MTQPIGPHSRTFWPDEPPGGSSGPENLPDLATFATARPPILGQSTAFSQGLRTASAQAVRRVGPSISPGPSLIFDAAQNAYVLSEAARNTLQPLFDPLGFDVSHVSLTLVPAWRVGWRNDAYTVGDSVTVNRNNWNRSTPTRQLGLLVHEIMHSVQYARLGYAHFLGRYAIEYFQRGNYDVPPALAAIPVRSLDPVDPRFTLDQIAERMAMKFSEGR